MSANDKELLELAAKAAGIDYSSRFENGSLGIGYAGLTKWNPLTDDGDALRLAVKLGILLRTDFIRLLSELLENGVNHGKATRLAITSIAAEIGRMK